MGSAFALGLQRADDRRKDREQHADVQRQDQLQVALQDATTPEERASVLRDAYAKDPSKVKQFVEDLTRRAVGKQAQPAPSAYATPSTTTTTPEIQAGSTTLPASAPTTVTGPAPKTRQEAFAGHAARGKTPAQQNLDQQRASGDIANQQSSALSQQEAQQKQQQTFALIDQYIKDPEQNRAAKEDYVRRQAGIQANFKNLPGAAGQTYKNANGHWVRPVQSADGTVVELPMPAGYTGPQAKPRNPLYKVIRNHAVLLDPNTGQVLHDLGLASLARTTSRQAIQTDADGVPHIVTLMSVSTPGGGIVDVDMAPEPGDAATAPKGLAPRKPSGQASPQPKANQLDFRKATPQSNAAKKGVDTAENSYLDVQKAGANGTLDPVGSQGVVLSWLRGRVNRVTATEIKAVQNLGGIFDKFDGTVSSLEHGTMTPLQYQWFLRSAKDNYENAQQVASKYSSPAPKSGQAGGGKSLSDRLNDALQ